MYGETFRLEGAPTQEQRDRLEDVLYERTGLSRRYGLLIDTYVDDGVPVVVDLQTDTVVGLDLRYFVDPKDQSVVTTYTCEDSILDGVWVVDSPHGPVEQGELNGSYELRRRQLRGRPLSRRAPKPVPRTVRGHD